MQAQLAERVAAGLLEQAKKEEQKLDAQLKSLEELDEDDYEVLRQKRMLALQKKARQEQDWRQLGHGRYMELTDTKEFFGAAKKSERMVAHFFRGVTPRCEIVDAHLERLSAEHVETRFVKINAEKNPFLVERLGIIILPTIVLIKDGHTDHSLRGFDEMGGVDDFTTDDLAYVLGSHKVLFYSGDRSDEIKKNAGRGGLNSMRLNIRSGGAAADDDNDF